ncbi:hypothetical protein [Comamonas testosteroni]|uniref:hypothetical protein n=1 Tax=Comamonas testosteroni TaxID=285 RepID=UPI001E2932A1|nr:hypothetical protein [Comamonas testosteroni]
MSLDALFDVALHAGQLLRRKPLQIETPQILAIGFTGIDMPGMLGEELQKGIVPQLGSVVRIKEANRHFQLVQGKCHDAENRDQDSLHRQS